VGGHGYSPEAVRSVFALDNEGCDQEAINAAMPGRTTIKKYSTTKVSKA